MFLGKGGIIYRSKRANKHFVDSWSHVQTRLRQLEQCLATDFQPIFWLLEGAALIGTSPEGGFKCHQRKSIRNIDSQEVMLLFESSGTYASTEGCVPSFQNDKKQNPDNPKDKLDLHKP